MQVIQLILLSSIFFVSGFVTMGMQIIWQRYIQYGVGGDVYASTLMLSTALVGIGLGSVLSGYIPNRFVWKWYARIHGVLALFGFLSIHYSQFASGVSSIFFRISDVSSPVPLVGTAAVSALVFCLPMIAVGVSISLMYRIGHLLKGNTFPSLTYGLCLTGSAVALIGFPLWFFPIAPLHTLMLTLAFVSCAVCALVIVPLKMNSESDIREDGTWYDVSPAIKQLAFFSMWSGGVSSLVETMAIRIYSPVWPSSGFHYPFIVFVFLLGYAIGSALSLILFGRSKQPIWRRIGYVAGVAMCALVWLYVYRIPLVTVDFWSMFRMYITAFLPYATIHGMIFPLILSESVKTSGHTQKNIATLFAANALGTLVCVFGYQVILLTLKSSVPAILTIIGSYACIFFLALPRKYTQKLVVPIALSLLVMAMAYRYIPWATIISGSTIANTQYAEGSSGIARIDWNETGTEGPVVVNGQYMSNMPRHPRHIQLQTYAAVQPKRGHILLLGLGSGGMVVDLLKDPGVLHIDVVDWSLELIELIRTPKVTSILGRIHDDPRVTLYGMDAKTAVRILPGGSYDIVIDNLAVVDWGGATGIKSLQFMSDIRRVLAPDGRYILETNHKDDVTYQAILATLTRIFPTVRTHYDGIAVSGSTMDTYDEADVSRVTSEFGPLFGLTGSGMDWFTNGWKEHTRSNYASVEPITDDAIYFEYRR